MNDFTIRRRLLEDGESEYAIAERIAEMAEQRHNELRDRAAEEHFKGTHENSDNARDSTRFSARN